MNYDSRDVKRATDAFCLWLSERGAEVLATTNEWELIRFRSSMGTSIIYTNSHGNINFTGESWSAWEAYKTGGTSWRAMPVKRQKVSSEQRTIRKRDGNNCFYCLRPVDLQDASIEHLVSVTHGGPSHISNLFLTHKRCNQKVGNLSAPEKIAVHVQAHFKLTEKI